MPVDPSISLGASPTGYVSGGLPAAAPAAGGGLDTVSRFAEIQNALNQNKLFQQTFAARQGIAEIMAGSNSLDEAYSSALKSPYAAFVPEVMNSIRQSQLLGLEMAEKQQGMTQSAVSFTLKNLLPALSNPELLGPLESAGFATTSPMVQRQAGGAIDSINTMINFGNPTPQQKQVRIAELLLGSGMTPEVIKTITGTPGTMPGIDPRTGLATTVPGVFAGPMAGGGFTPSGGAQITGMTPGEAVTTHPGPISPSLQQTQVTGSDIFRGAIPGLGGPFAPVGAANALGGAATAPAPGQTKVIEGAGQNFTDEGRKAYDAAITGLASVQYMDRAFDEMAKGGGWEVPGTAVNARLGIAKGINTLAQVLGTAPDKLLFDQNKIGTWEDFNKESKRAGMQLINQMFGAQRESQMVFQAGAQAVPNAENTPQGGKLVLRSLEQTMYREVDRRNFETNWFNEHQGNLVGANEAFNSTYPPQLYSQRAISTVQPYEINSPADAANFLPGTIVRRKSDGATFTVTPQVSKYKPVKLTQQGQ